mmetsp:Transcript_90016/g.215036  ORF Transcript_90016/g.215036 Transcript_90016/m.215036 type:complete len:98 (-) Transcript_90016:155-448(-)
MGVPLDWQSDWQKEHCQDLNIQCNPKRPTFARSLGHQENLSSHLLCTCVAVSLENSWSSPSQDLRGEDVEPSMFQKFLTHPMHPMHSDGFGLVTRIA